MAGIKEEKKIYLVGIYCRLSKPDRNVEISQSVITDEDQSLDRSIQEAKNKLNTEQLEKRIEQFKQSKKPKNG